jgi:hypothetical protein
MMGERVQDFSLTAKERPMPNTPEENQLVREALNDLSRVYNGYLKNNTFFQEVVACPSDKLFNYVHFLDDGPFRTNSQLTGIKVATGCQLLGFTDRKGSRYSPNHHTVYINRVKGATPGTVLHELLHGLSHDGWFVYFSTTLNKKAWVNEGVTQYLTKRVIKYTGNSKFEVDQTGIYEDEVKNVKGVKKMVKGMWDANDGALPQADFYSAICDAYFKGLISSQLTMSLSFR